MYIYILCIYIYHIGFPHIQLCLIFDSSISSCWLIMVILGESTTAAFSWTIGSIGYHGLTALHYMYSICTIAALMTTGFSRIIIGKHY